LRPDTGLLLQLTKGRKKKKTIMLDFFRICDGNRDDVPIETQDMGADPVRVSAEGGEVGAELKRLGSLFLWSFPRA
jgi:hypothetical protein